MNNIVFEKTVIIIPSYEPPSAFISYIDQLIEAGFLNIVIVNDGSSEKYQHIYDALRIKPECEIIEYAENRGKGYALKTAFTYCYEKYDEGFVFTTADCDGQHLIPDVINVTYAAFENKNTLILGSRDFSHPSVPKRSKTGNLTTRSLYKFLYGIELKDTQTGLRAFEYSMLPVLIAIRGDRFEYEMNMLIMLHKQHYKTLEVDIATVYEDKPEDVERISHFRTIKDSLKVMRVLFKNPGRFLLSSLLSSVIEVLAFFVLTILMHNTNIEQAALIALITTMGARFLSSTFNYFFNFKFVFQTGSRRSVFRYYILAVLLLSASYGVACGFTALFDPVRLSISATASAVLTTLCKGTCDLLLGAASYGVQSNWVFAEKNRTRYHFYGVYFRFARRVYHLFKRKLTAKVKKPFGAPKIYVCRHRNLKGPVAVASSFDFDLHFYILNCFFTFKECYKQYSTYTFTERYKRKGLLRLLGKIKAFFAALAVAPLVRSARAIPVYRGRNDSVKTFRKTMECLELGESVAVFPDIDYTADETKKSEIYSGFLYIDKLYFKKHSKHIDFVVINVDDKTKSIDERGTVSFTGKLDFKDELSIVASEIQMLLMA